MRNGKFTSLALLSVFTVEFAQSSAVSATVNSGKIEAAAKVNSGENGKSDSTAKGNDNAETKGLSCASPENGNKTVFISKDKKPQSSGSMSAGQVVSVAAVTFGVPGAILGAKKVVELVEKGENENPPSETSENSEQQSTSGSGTTSGQHGNNAGDLTVPADASIGSSKGNSSLGLYLLVGGIIIFVIVVCFLINAKKKKNAGENNFEELFNDFADNGLRSNVKKNNVLLVKILEIAEKEKFDLKVAIGSLNSFFNPSFSCLEIIKGIFSKFENIEAPQNNYNEEQVARLANAFVILLKDSSDGLVKFLSAFNDQKYSQLIIDLIDKSYVIDGEHSALAGLCVLQSMLVLSYGDHLFDDNYDENIEKNLVGLFSAEDEVKRKCALNNFINFLSSICKASKEDTTKAKGKAKNFLEVLLKHGDLLAASFARDNFDVNNFTNDLENDGFELNSFVKKWGLVENHPLP